MRFEFKPSEHNSSFKEYMSNIYQDLEVFKVYKKAIWPLLITLISYSIITVLSKYFASIFFNIIFLAVILIIVFLIALIIIFTSRKIKKAKKVRNNKFYDDLESNFTFIIEDGYLTRENQFSTVKIPLENIDKIKLLKEGITLCHGKQAFILVPKAVLPVTVNEFIALFKAANPQIIIEDVVMKNRKYLLKYILFFITMCYLALAASHFIGKYNYENNFPTYNLIMENEMVTLGDNSFLYKNENLKYSIVFPESWSGKFGIEEKEDYINIYYLENGQQNSNTNLLCTVRDEENPPPFGEYIQGSAKFTNNAIYTLWSPRKVYMDDNPDAKSEYLNMYYELSTLSLKGL